MADLFEFDSTGSQGRDAGLTRIFDRYYRPLVLFADEYVRDIETAKDIVQDFFLALWKDDRISQVAGQRLASYLYTSVRNACRTRLSRRDMLRDCSRIGERDIPVEWVSAIDDETLRTARLILDSLPPRTCQTVEYVIMQGDSYKEAAARMGISVNTVKYLLKSGMKKAREISPPVAYLLLCCMLCR